MPKYQDGDQLIVTKNRLLDHEYVYHNIPIGSIVKVIDSHERSSDTYGPCYKVFCKETFSQQYIYESSLRPAVPVEFLKSHLPSGLPII